MKFKLAIFCSSLMIGTGAFAQQIGIPAGFDFELYDKECAVYYAAARKLAEDGITASARMTSGCPTQTAAIYVDINKKNQPFRYTTDVAGTIFERMIRRGMPEELARQVAMSPAFEELVAGYSSKS